VIDVALLGIIRRWHLRDQIPIREIARRLGISRNTVRRYLRSETTEPSYAERRSATGLDKYSVLLSSWLKVEATRPRKQRRNLKQLHLELKELGYGGSYDRVAAFARQWKAGQLEWVNSASKRTCAVAGQVRPFVGSKKVRSDKRTRKMQMSQLEFKSPRDGSLLSFTITGRFEESIEFSV